jgi:hypothetical protein
MKKGKKKTGTEEQSWRRFLLQRSTGTGVRVFRTDAGKELSDYLPHETMPCSDGKKSISIKSERNGIIFKRKLRIRIMAGTAKKRTREKTGDIEIKASLMDKYRDTFIDKLTPADLEELQLYRMKQYDKERGWNNEYRQKFEVKLRHYFHEEVLRREIASIETLLMLLQPEDLKNQTLPD